MTSGLSGLIAAAMLANSASQAVEGQCLAPAQADAVLLTIMPDMLGGASRACTTSLPPTAVLRAGMMPLADRFRAEAAIHKAEAGRGLERMTGRKLADGEAEKMFPTLSRETGDNIASSIKSQDCTAINEAVEILAPLPPRDMVRLMRVMANLSGAGELGQFTICKAGER